MIYFKQSEGHYYDELLPDLPLIEKTIARIERGELAAGRHQLTESLAVAIFSYETAKEIERNWEAHEHHLDVHVLLKGQESIGFATTEGLKKENVDKVNDSYEFQTDSDNYWKLEPGERLVIFPNEGHKTGIATGVSMTVSKAVFKIKG